MVVEQHSPRTEDGRVVFQRDPGILVDVLKGKRLEYEQGL